MKPLRLRLENFTSFREPVVLDFEKLNLFAITGPTGAGKSSLLDAMIFALYGEVPRIGGRGLGELIALGRDRMGVIFDFAVRDRRFRVARTIRRRGGAAQVQLDEVGVRGEMPVCSGVRDTGDKIKQLIGLTYEAFTRAVVLPQGEFANFLKSAPGDQRRILRDLLRLQVYERMRDIAARQRDQLRLIVAQLEDRLGKDYADATAETLESRRQQQRTLTGRIKKLAAELKMQEERLNILRRRRDQTRELEQKRSLLAQLANKQSSIAASETRIDAARRAAPVTPLIEAAERASERVNKTTEEVARARAERDALMVAIHQLKSKLDRAEHEAERLPQLRKQTGALEQVLGQLKTRDSLGQRLLEIRRNARACKVELQAAEKQKTSGLAELERRQARLTKITQDLEAIGYSPELDQALDGVRNSATALESLREAAAQKAVDTNTASARVKHEQENIIRTGVALEKATQELQSTTQRVSELQAAHDAAHQQHAAAILRRQLRMGEPCPVCAQPVNKRPAAIAAPHLEQAEANLKKARTEESAQRKSLAEARDAAAMAQASAKEARRTAEKAAEDLDKARTRIEGLEREMVAQVGQLVADQPGATIEKRILRAVAYTAQLRQRHQDTAEAQDNARKACDEARGDVEKARGAEDKAAALLSQAEREIKGLQAEVDRVNSEIAKVTQAPDPKAERERLIGVCTELEDTLNQARQEHGAVERRLSAGATKADESEKALRQAVEDMEQAQRAARAALTEAGFQGEAAVKKAALPGSEIARLEMEVRDWTRERDAGAKREKELLEELGNQQISEEDLRQQEALFSNQKNAHADVLSDYARCGQIIRHLEDQIKRALELTAELKQHQANYQVYAQLADDLRGERFQAFLLEEVFRDLVRGASERLWNLTEVYRLEWHDGTFHVIDHDNARQRRTADTLSGGETFLASLALALELSEQVQRASGAVPLDSLFIDEGFGTLDPETLDDVAGAIERLQSNGRIVGIITHLEELSARLPVRVRVSKRADGSQIEIDAN